MKRIGFFFATLLLTFVLAYAGATVYGPQSEFDVILLVSGAGALSMAAQIFYLFRARRPLWRRAATFGFAAVSGWAAILVVRLCMIVVTVIGEGIGFTDAIPMFLFPIVFALLAIFAVMHLLWTLATDLPHPLSLWFAAIASAIAVQFCFQVRGLLLQQEAFNLLLSGGAVITVLPITLCLLAYERKFARRAAE